MENSNDVKIVTMLGEMNTKINDIGNLLESLQERMNKNFRILAESQISTNEKLNDISADIKSIKFKTEVLESGVGLNASKIGELSDRNT